jgi:DNA integrity scanning protein DisA with diadenylate cyclase activity
MNDINDITNVNENNNAKFTIEEKKNLVKMIETVKSKKVLIKIFKIINNDTNKYSKNNNGVFINLKNVSNKALNKIKLLINNYNKELLEQQSETTLSETLSFHKDEFKDFEDSSGKLSNHEKNILRKNRLEKQNKKSKNIVYGSFLSSETDEN